MSLYNRCSECIFCNGVDVCISDEISAQFSGKKIDFKTDTSECPAFEDNDDLETN